MTVAMLLQNWLNQLVKLYKLASPATCEDSSWATQPGRTVGSAAKGVSRAVAYVGAVRACVHGCAMEIIAGPGTTNATDLRRRRNPMPLALIPPSHHDDSVNCGGNRDSNTYFTWHGFNFCHLSMCEFALLNLTGDGDEAAVQVSPAQIPSIQRRRDSDFCPSFFFAD